jgi:hypothetical protein
MKLRRLVCCLALSSASYCSPLVWAQQQQLPPTVPTFRTTSNLVFLDVTVLDKKGRPVINGLTKDDFSITEEDKARNIFSFEPGDNAEGD